MDATGPTAGVKDQDGAAGGARRERAGDGPPKEPDDAFDGDLCACTQFINLCAPSNSVRPSDNYIGKTGNHL
jgi:hypothetical protein